MKMVIRDKNAATNPGPTRPVDSASNPPIAGPIKLARL